MTKTPTRILDINDHGVSQLINSPNQWALDLWSKGCANNWMPQEIDMSGDIKQWSEEGVLSDDEKLLVKRTLGLFAMGESMVSNSINTVETRFITDGALRQYLLRKNYEESLHNFTVKTCCDAYSLKYDEVAEAYLNIPTIMEKDKFLMRVLDSFGPDFDITTKEGKQMFVKNMAVFYLILEGTWFFSNFALIMSLGRQNKLINLCDQIDYTIRDESLHVEFGVNVINQIKREYPAVWTKKLQAEIRSLVKEGVEVELKYAKDILPRGILGVNETMLGEYIKFLADGNLTSVGLEPIFDQKTNPFPWLGETQDAQGMSAFFERKEKNYQHSGVLKDDF